MGHLPEKIDLSDVGLFAHGIPHEIFRHLRRESPIYWNEEACGSGFWALTRHADVLSVNRDSETFSSERRGVMILDESFETSGRERMMIEMDPPRHTRLRSLINRGMTPRRVHDLEEFARRSFSSVLDRSLELGRCDFVKDVATLLPLQIITELLGIPENDRPLLGALADRIQGFDDPELGGGDGENTDAIREMSDYALELARDRRSRPRADITTAILQTDLDGETMGDDAFAAFFLLLITCGIETTKAAISGGMLALTEHPDQWAALRRDPDALPGAIEEMIRWVTPIQHFRRTATRGSRKFSP